MMTQHLDIDALYRAHGHHVYRRAKRMLGSEDEAREVLQDIFVGLIQHPEQYAGKSQFTTWLYSSTTHACLNRIRNRKTRARVLSRESSGATEAMSPSVESTVQAANLLARLPRDLALVAVYHYIDEMTHDEIASLLGCSRRHVGDVVIRIKQWAMAEEREPS